MIQTARLLENKIAVITGAAQGIGFATAKAFADAGATVILMGRTLEKLEEACNKITDENADAKVKAITCDVANHSSVKDAFQAVFKKYKSLHILVANAGILTDALIGMATPQQVEETFNTNTFGVVYCTQYASRLIARSGGGAIITMSSIMGIEGNIGNSIYSGSKAAVIGITKSLAKELASQKIRVNAIAPGFIDTDMTRSMQPEKYEEKLASIKLGRAGAPEEVANTALFLASDLSSYITGQVIGVDGGMLV